MALISLTCANTGEEVLINREHISKLRRVPKSEWNEKAFTTIILLGQSTATEVEETYQEIMSKVPQ